MERLQIWASFHDPGLAHAKHVAGLVLQLYDGLSRDGIPGDSNRETCRYILRAAALMHDVGHSSTKLGHHKASARLIRKLDPPMGWTADEVRLTAIVARYHRGALPRKAKRVLRHSRSRSGGWCNFSAVFCDWPAPVTANTTVKYAAFTWSVWTRC
jgi:exopolyphosphatase/pppGpp-phosphohydrolase